VDLSACRSRFEAAMRKVGFGPFAQVRATVDEGELQTFAAYASLRMGGGGSGHLKDYSRCVLLRIFAGLSLDLQERPLSRQ
jgi:hypothetical protein